MCVDMEGGWRGGVCVDMEGGECVDLVDTLIGDLVAIARHTPTPTPTLQTPPKFKVMCGFVVWCDLRDVC